MFIGVEGWKFVKANEKLKSLILLELRPVLGEQLQIRQVHVSFGNIHLLNVHLPIPGHPVDIHIKDLRIGYSFLNLLIHGFDPKYISQDALFVEPHIIIYAPASDTLENLQTPFPDSTRQFRADRLMDNSSLLYKLFHYISLKGGSISYEYNDTTRVVLAHSLQGGIFHQSSDSLFINMDGSFYNSNQSDISLVGYGNPNTSLFDHIKVRLENYSLDHGLPLPPQNMIQVSSGAVSAEFDVTHDAVRHRYLVKAGGEIKEAGGAFLNDRFEFQRMNGRFRLENGDLYIDSSEQWINESPVSVSGKIHLLQPPTVDLEVASPQLSLAQIAPVFGKNKINGVCSLQSRIYGDLKNPLVDGQLATPRLTFDGTELYHFSSEFSYHDGQLNVQQLNSRLAGYELHYRGSINLASADKDLRGILKGTGQFTPRLASLGMDSTLQINTKIDAELSGSLKQPMISGKYNLAFLSALRDSLLLNTNFTLAEKKLHVTSEPTANAPTIDARIDMSHLPVGLEVTIDRAEKLVDYFRYEPRLQTLLNNAASSVRVTGTTRQLKVNTKIEQLSGGLADGELCDLTLDIARSENALEGSGKFALYPGSAAELQGGIKFKKSPEGWSIDKFSIGDQLASTLQVNYGENAIHGTIRCDQLDLTRLWDGKETLPKGFLNAQIDFSGRPDAPLVKGSIRLENISYQELGPYQSFIDFTYNSGQFNLDRFLLNLGQSTLLYAQGNYQPNNRGLDFTVKGAGFNAENIYRAVGKDTLISGETLVNLHVGGSLAAPDLEGVIAVKNGRISRTPFDEMELRLGGEPEQNQLQPRIRVNSFRLSRLNEYNLLANGFYPLHSSDSLFLNIDGSGNFLKILGDIDPFFKNPRGACTVTGRIRGTPLNPQIDAAHLTINNAEMEFASVIPPLTDLKGELSFSPTEQYFRLSALEGKMGGKLFQIHNEPAQSIISKRPLQNITFSDSWLNLGVLVLETSDKGVPLNFVGLMEPNKFGNLELLGREKGEKFYFAMTPEGLILRGKINLSETDVMYPFYEVTHKPSSKVREFLENLIWDISVSPIKNTRFVRNFPGAIDEVYVNLKIDEQFGGLDFSGKIADESFRINGQLRSTKGFIEYLDMNFRVDQAGVEFDRSSLVPVVFGQARATVTDSLGISSSIILTMQTVDNTMDKKSVDDIVRQEEGRARFDRIRFKLSSDNPNIGNSEAQILASLGYSSGKLGSSALAAIGLGTDNLILRPLFRPFERELENTFRLDYVRFSSQLTRNIIQFNLNNNLDLNKRLMLLESTKIIVGKYISSRLFFQYTGQIESGVGYRYKEKNLGIHHTFGLDYQINPQVLLELEYDYDSLMLYNRDDKRMVVRHWFPF
jgi:hypothetical protein